jgi:hypothetical protein
MKEEAPFILKASLYQKPDIRKLVTKKLKNKPTMAKK